MTHIIFAPNCASIRNLVIEIDFKKNDLLIVYHSKPENIRCRWVSDFLSFCKALTFLFFLLEKLPRNSRCKDTKNTEVFTKLQKWKSFFVPFYLRYESIHQTEVYLCITLLGQCVSKLFTFAISIQKFNFAQSIAANSSYHLLFLS